MAMSLDDTLITIDDVRNIRKLTKHYNEDEFNAFVREIQRNYLEKLIGYDLYTDLLTNKTDTNYVDLLDGKVYEPSTGVKFRFGGVKLYLVYLFLYLYVREGDINYTESGPKQYGAQNSNSANSALQRDVINQHFKNAERIGDDILKFLKDNISDYPEYRTTQVDASVNQRQNFKVHGNTITRSSDIL